MALIHWVAISAHSYQGGLDCLGCLLQLGECIAAAEAVHAAIGPQAPLVAIAAAATYFLLLD